VTGFLFTLLTLQVVSGEALRFVPVYKQGYDSSCGIAVTATLLNNYWGIPVSEAGLIQDMIGSPAEGDGRNTYSISFLTMAGYLRKQGIAARPFRMDWDGLADSLGKGYAPIVVHYEKPMPHFALLLRQEGDYAIVADPARGCGIVSRQSFERNYSGNALLTASTGALKDKAALERNVERERKRLASLRRLASGRQTRAGPR
jgi:predicted double-glycine peptidase